MASNFRFVVDTGGVGQLLKSPQMQAVIMGKANAVDGAAGPGHDVKNTTTNRARATVMTITLEARIAEAKSHNLTRAINAARS